MISSYIPFHIIQNVKNNVASIEFIRWFPEFSATTNLGIFCETEFVILFLCTVNVKKAFIFVEKIVDS